METSNSNDDEDVWGGEEEDRELLFLSQFCELKTTHQSDIPPLDIKNSESIDIGQICADRLKELPDPEDPDEATKSLENKIVQLLSEKEQMKNNSFTLQGENNLLRKYLDEEKKKRRTENYKLTQTAEVEKQKLKKALNLERIKVNELKIAQMKEGLKITTANKRKSNGDLAISTSLTQPPRSTSTSPGSGSTIPIPCKIRNDVQSIQVQVNSCDLVPIDERNEILKEKYLSLAIQNVDTMWEENLFKLESTVENAVKILQSIVDEKSLKPQMANLKLVSKTFFFRAALERREERTREGLPSFAHPDLKMPNEFGPGIFHGTHDEILKELLNQTSAFQCLHYIRIFIKSKFFERFRGLDILGSYQKTHFLSFFKLFIWAKELWNLLVNIEKQKIVNLKLSIQPQTLVGELCKWTSFILQSDTRNFLTLPLEVLFRSVTISIFESIIELGYFDHRTKCYLKLEKLLLHTLDKSYHSSSKNVQAICKIIGMLTSKEKIFNLLCKSKSNKINSRCFCIDLSLKIKNIFQDKNNQMTSMERVEIFLAYMEMLNTLKSSNFIEISSIAKEWNQTHCNNKKENKSTVPPVPVSSEGKNEESKDDDEIRAIFIFNPPNPVLSDKINGILAKTEEEIEEEKDKVKLIVHWDSNANSVDMMNDSQMFSEVSQVIIPCGKNHREHCLDDPDGDLFAEESMEIEENDGGDLKNCLKSDEDKTSWLSPLQWEDRHNTLCQEDQQNITTCKCRKSFVSSTISMIHTLVQLWEADYLTRVGKNEILLQNKLSKSEKMSTDSKRYFYDDFPLSLLKIEEEERVRGPAAFNAKLKMNNEIKAASSSKTDLKKVKLDPMDMDIQVIEESSSEGEDDEIEPKKEELEDKILNAIIEGAKFLLWIYSQSENVWLALGSEGFDGFIKTLASLKKAFRKGLKIDQELEWGIIDAEEDYNKTDLRLVDNDLPIEMICNQWKEFQVLKNLL